MGRYTAYFGAFATTTAVKTALSLVPAATNVMCEMVEMTMTGDGITAAADIQHDGFISKSTIGAAGTSTTITAEPNDDASNAARTITKVKYSAEGTTIGTGRLGSIGFNQRGGMRLAWPRGEGIFVYQPLTNKGIVVCVISSAVGTVEGYGSFWEP
jgi:hypothetical protein